MRRCLPLARVLLILAVCPLVTGAPRAAVQPAPLDRPALANRVRAEFRHAWDGYVRAAWGHDELNPVSGTVHDWYPPAVFDMTPVDALDTMLVMGLTDEAHAAKALLLDTLSFDKDCDVQVFEVTI